MLRVHFLQQWYALSDPSMEEALYDTAVMRRFAGIGGLARIPDETTTLNFRKLLEAHGLAAEMLNAVNAHLQRNAMSLRAGTIVDRHHHSCAKFNQERRQGARSGNAPDP